MLQELDVDSYAVVDRLRLAFQPGLNILTGETGSGKSIVVGSLALLLGSRASADLVRSGARRARVSGRFDAPRDRAALDRLSSAGIECDGDELIVERQVLASGKSRAYVNGSPATVGLLRDLAPHLGDIHGQHEQQTLLSAAHQLQLLDAFAGTAGDAAELRALHRRWRRTGEALAKLRGSERERLRRIDLLRYQVGEIRDTAVRPGEDRDLEVELQRLSNAEQLRRCGFAACEALYDAETSASSRIKAAIDALGAVAADGGPFERFAASLEDTRSAVDDVAFELRSCADRLCSDPQRQEEVENRLAALERLQRKYGPSLEEVLEFAERSERELGQLAGSDAESERLEQDLQEAATDYERRSSDLSLRRRRAASELSTRTEEQLRDLALAKARFEVAVDELAGWSANGVDRAALRFSANPGQPPRPLGQAASGGELSRIALALKTCLEETGTDGPYRRTLVFDEIDTGVGGGVADAIGRRFRKLSAGHQLLCVTHLPQIARFADAHFHVAKSESEERSSATVAELGEAQRVEELARMLSGAEISAAAIENARQLLLSP